MSSAVPTCPGLFYATPAQDGFLVRIRVPGGVLTAQQSVAIAQLAVQEGTGTLEITNRANLQLRGLSAPLSATALQTLQTLGLAATTPAIDALRNLMISPTAGIDPQMVLDTRPLVTAWNAVLDTRPDLAVLSPKFSVGIDGGEGVSVGDRRNDINLTAVQDETGVYFRLGLHLDRALQDAGVRVAPEGAIDVLVALAEVYRDYTLGQPIAPRKPRLRHLLADWGIEAYLAQVERYCPTLERTDARYTSPLNPPKLEDFEQSQTCSKPAYAHLGRHPQRQAGHFYLGCVPALGHLTIAQLQAIATLAQHYGSGTLRLTPWRTVLLPDLPEANVPEVQAQLEALELPCRATHPLGGMVACSGVTGCRAGLTDTQSHARTAARYLEQAFVLDAPVNIHFSGCHKSCAQPHPAEITLVGLESPDPTAYRVYVGRQTAPFGRELWGTVAAEQVPRVLVQVLRQYQQHRHSDESFGTFVDRQAIADLQTLFAREGEQPS